MDFTYGEEQEAVRELAGRIFTEQSTHERLKAVEQAAGDEGPFDRELWTALADAGLLGIGLPEDVGGAGLDFVAVCLVVEAAGRTAAHVPVVATLAYGAPALDRFGTDEQRQRWLPRVASGQAVVTAALAELVGDVVVPGGGAPATTATRQAGGGWKLDGTKACVPAGLVADLVLVPASILADDGQPEGTGVFLVPTDAAGVTRTRQDGAALPEALLELSGVAVGADALLGTPATGDSATGGTAIDGPDTDGPDTGAPGADGPDTGGPAVVGYVAEHATAALCVQEAGACAAALALTGEYAKTREQFGKPIATFQAVGQRAADAYVDTEAIRLTAWQAAWRLSEGLPATAEVAVAKFWAADGGQRVVHAAAHLHGGVGVDRDYPLHRYFLLTHQIELTLGGAHDSLARLGAMLATDPA